VHVALTDEGLRVFEGLAVGHEAEVGTLFGGLSEADLDQLTEILKRMGRDKE
jgi:DNA-binding MarR family transcriptional regulator